MRDSAAPQQHQLLKTLCDDHSDLLAAVLRWLTRRDAAAVAGVCRSARSAVAALSSRELQRVSPAPHLPRLFVACSGTSLLVEVPLDGASRAANHAWCLRKPPRARKRPHANSIVRSPKSWPTSIAISPWDRHLHVCNYACDGVLRLSAPPQSKRQPQRAGSVALPPPSTAAVRRLIPGRSVFASRKGAMSGPEGITFAANGFLYVVTINGKLVQIDARSGAVLSTSQQPDPRVQGVGWPLVPWGMASWPLAGGAQQAAGAEADAAGGGSPPKAAPASVCQLFVASELDYTSNDYTDPPPDSLADGECVHKVARAALEWLSFHATVSSPQPQPHSPTPTPHTNRNPKRNRRRPHHVRRPRRGRRRHPLDALHPALPPTPAPQRGLLRRPRRPLGDGDWRRRRAGQDRGAQERRECAGVRAAAHRHRRAAPRVPRRKAVGRVLDPWGRDGGRGRRRGAARCEPAQREEGGPRGGRAGEGGGRGAGAAGDGAAAEWGAEHDGGAVVDRLTLCWVRGWLSLCQAWNRQRLKSLGAHECNRSFRRCRLCEKA